MDLSQWRKTFPNLTISETRSRYYGKFFHKLVYRVPGSNFFCSVNEISALEKRLQRSYEKIPADRLEMAKTFCEFYLNRNSEYRIRIENNVMCIFHNDLDYLYDLATVRFKKYQTSLQYLTTVFDDAGHKALEAGKFIMKIDNGYSHKVNVRSGFYRNQKENLALVGYLQNLGHEVKVSENLFKDLITYKYIQSRYFYVKDPAIVSMLMLIQPRFIKSIQEIVVK
jgi:hypothetical protein